MLKLNKNTSARIIDEQYSLARAIVGRQLDLPSPRQKSPYHERRTEFLESAMYCLSHLATAVAVSRPSLFADYVAWSKVTWLQRSIPLSELRKHLQCTQDVIGEALPGALARPACLYVAEALRRLPEFPQKMPAIISQQSPLGELARRYLDTLLRGDRLAATTLIIEDVNQGTNIQDIYLNVFERCQYEIGRLWQMNKISVAQEHYCTAVTQWVMSQLYPKILSTNKIGKKAIFVCVSGELHEIGGRMVADCLEMEGWDTFYLGANTPTDGIIQALTERTPDVLGISVTMTSHLDTAENLIGAIRKSRIAQNMKILLGGRPFKLTTNLWRELGADGSACDATSAVLAAKHLVEKGEQDCAHAQIRRYSLAL